MSRRLAPVLGPCLAILFGCAARQGLPSQPSLTAASASAAPVSSAELSPEERCKQGNLASCLQRALERAKNVRADTQEGGLKELRALCDQGLADACAHWGDLSWGTSKPRARQAFERGCSLGSMLACAHQGFAAHEDAPDSPRSRELLKKACDGGSPEGCTWQAEVMQPKQWGAEEIGAYWALMTRGCQGKVARACRRLGEREMQGDGVPRDPVAAAAHFQTACDGRDAEGCTHWGDAQRTGKGTPSDDKGAARSYGAACDLGDQNGCYWLAIAYEQGLGVAKNTPHAAELLRGACKAGEHDSCKRLAWDEALEADEKRRQAVLEALCAEQAQVACWALGEALSWTRPVEAARAIEKLETACASGLQGACYSGYFAVLAPHRRASSPKLNKQPGPSAKAAPKPPTAVASRALSFLERACPKTEQSPACVELASQLFTGESLPRDARKGAELSLSLCEQGHAAACKNAADALLRGEGVSKDAPRAAAAYGKACEGNEPAACRSLAKLARQGTGTPKNPAKAEELERRASSIEDD